MKCQQLDIKNLIRSCMLRQSGVYRDPKLDKIICFWYNDRGTVIIHFMSSSIRSPKICSRRIGRSYYCHRVVGCRSIRYTSLGLRRCVDECFFYEVFSMHNKLLTYFSLFEICLWSCSILLTAISFAVFDRENYIMLTASVIGATYLIFNAKGNPIGQVLLVIFSFLYGIISYNFSYYGEMVTYLGMSTPMAVLALISWIRNPYEGNRAEVKINSLEKPEIVFLLVLTNIITFIFYFILKYFHTANLIPSTVSVTTSFLAVYLSFRRSRYFTLAYAANDMILIFLWILAALSDVKYISVTVCFAMFLVNDIYGYVNWTKMQKRQKR